MPNTVPTKQSLSLIRALENKNIKVVPEYWDGHKHVDIYIPENEMYIEIEGLQHFTDAKQILADLKRDYYSDKENHFTFRITNQLIETHLEEIVDAIVKLIYTNRDKKPLSNNI